MKKFLLLKIAVVAMLLPLTARAQDTVYACDFDQPGDTAGWHLLNGIQVNRWVIGRDSSMSSNAMFIANVDTFTNYYDRSMAYRSVIYAYRQVILPRGLCHISYDWRCTGWNGWERDFTSAADLLSDYMRVALVPDSLSFTAGAMPGEEGFSTNSVPTGGIAIDGGSPLTEWDYSGSLISEVPPQSVWHTYTNDVVIMEEDTFWLVFFWIDESLMVWIDEAWENAVAQPPAAVDNIVIRVDPCPTPLGVHVENLTDRSFDVCWTDLSGGRATQWLVELCLEPDTQGQGMIYTAYDTSISFPSVWSDTNYTVYIRPVCSSDTGESTMQIQVHTPCVLIDSLPYIENFDSMINGQFVPCWTRLGRDSTDIYCQNGKLRWGLNGPRAARYVVLRGINTDWFPINELQFSFRCRNVDLHYPEVGVMTDPIDTGSFVSVPVIVLDTDDGDYTVHNA